MQDQSDFFNHYYKDLPLEDDYFLEEPEEISHKKRGVDGESASRFVAEIAIRREKKTLDGDVLVIGAGITGMQAALDVADKGYRVVLVDKSSTIGGNMVKLDKTFPTNDCAT